MSAAERVGSGKWEVGGAKGVFGRARKWREIAVPSVGRSERSPVGGGGGQWRVGVMGVSGGRVGGRSGVGNAAPPPLAPGGIERKGVGNARPLPAGPPGGGLGG